MVEKVKFHAYIKPNDYSPESPSTNLGDSKNLPDIYAVALKITQNLGIFI